MRSLIQTWIGVVLVAVVASAQQAKPDHSPVGKLVSKITFTRNWRDATPQFFSIEADSSGRAEYRSQTAQGNEQPYILEFAMPERERNKVFELAEKANYFSGNFASERRNVAQTGTKTLAYADATHNEQVTYNYSGNKYVEQLTALFVGLSDTIESGRKLEYLMQHDKLGLYQQLDSMEQSLKLGGLEDTAVIAPTLEQIANDPQYMNIARQKANELLELGRP